MNRPKGIDLFAGAGGMSLGFEQAGFDIVAAVEIDPVHSSTHHFNFPETPMLVRSVVGLSGSEILGVAGIRKGAVDVVFGGPPCQGFSLIGKRMLDDPRNQLVKEFVRLVVELDAKTFVFENVKGLTVGRHKSFLGTLIDAFSDAGYQVRIPWTVLNAMDYGVPQDRQRLFLLGSKAGISIPDYPEGSELLPNCFDALADLPDVDQWEELIMSDSMPYPRIVLGPDYANDYVNELICKSGKGWHFGYKREWDRNVITSSMRTAHTEESKRRFAATNEGNVEPVSRFFKLSRGGVCNTLRAGTDAARGAFTSPRPIHYAFPRCITVREMARLHGYPDWFRFHITKWHGARQVGNSVPPPLARAVASEVMKSLGTVPVQPSRKLDLGDPGLLAMGTREAAHYWGVPASKNRRIRR